MGSNMYLFSILFKIYESTEGSFEIRDSISEIRDSRFEIQYPD